MSQDREKLYAIFPSPEAYQAVLDGEVVPNFVKPHESTPQQPIIPSAIMDPGSMDMVPSGHGPATTVIHHHYYAGHPGVGQSASRRRQHGNSPRVDPGYGGPADWSGAYDQRSLPPDETGKGMLNALRNRRFVMAVLAMSAIALTGAVARGGAAKDFAEARIGGLFGADVPLAADAFVYHPVKDIPAGSFHISRTMKTAIHYGGATATQTGWLPASKHDPLVNSNQFHTEIDRTISLTVDARATGVVTVTNGDKPHVSDITIDPSKLIVTPNWPKTVEKHKEQWVFTGPYHSYLEKLQSIASVKGSLTARQRKAQKQVVALLPALPTVDQMNGLDHYMSSSHDDFAATKYTKRYKADLRTLNTVAALKNLKEQKSSLITELAVKSLTHVLQDQAKKEDKTVHITYDESKKVPSALQSYLAKKDLQLHETADAMEVTDGKRTIGVRANEPNQSANIREIKE